MKKSGKFVKSRSGTNFLESTLATRIKKHWQIYVIICFAMAWYIIFAYYPMSGLQLAFKTYKAREGIFGSPWSGFNNFSVMFNDMNFWRALWRTLQINLLKLVFVFPAPVVLALMFSEVRVRRTKKILQTVFTFPNFLSWVIVATLITNIFKLDGLVNSVITACGGEPLSFVGNPKFFQPMLYISDIWKNVGYSSIIYLAAISGIDQDQYEAAEIDGANRWQRLTRITFPNLLPTISIMLVMTCGSLVSGGFDQVFNLQNPGVKEASEILDMYIYRITFESSVDYGFSTAVSLFRSIVNMALLLVADRGSKALGGNGLFA